MRLRPLLLLLPLILMIAVSGCRKGDRLPPEDTMPVEQLYAMARSSLDTGNNERATQLYQRLISRFPFGPYTEQAHLELAFAQYRSRREEEALSSLNRFLRTYPTSPNADYAHYLRGLINFERTSGLLEQYLQQDFSERDQAFGLQSFQDFALLIQRFPESRYVPDARQRMIHLRNNLAQHELHVARYYFRRQAYVASANRARTIIENYQDSPQTPDALAILAESYRRLGQNEIAEDTLSVLRLNAPDHPYVRGVEAGGPGPLRRVWRWLGGRQS